MSKLLIQNRFGIAPIEILNNKNLTLKAKGLFTYMQSKPDDWDFSAKKISLQTKDGIDGVNSGLQELEKEGYLKRRKINNIKTGQWDIEYILYDKPTFDEDPVTEKPLTENPVTEKPLTENPLTYSNIEPSKIDISKKEKESSPFLNKQEEILQLFDLALDEEFMKVYKMFADTRNKETNHKITKASEKLFFGKLNKIDPRLHKWRKDVAITMINKALELNWRTIFPLKEKEIADMIKDDTIKTVKQLQQRNRDIEEKTVSKENEIKKILNEYWQGLTQEEKNEIEKEAYEIAKKEKPNLSEQFLKPLVMVAKKNIISKRYYGKK